METSSDNEMTSLVEAATPLAAEDHDMFQVNASREITSYTLVVFDGALQIETQIMRHTVTGVWDYDLMAAAIVYDIRPTLASSPPDAFFDIFPETLNITRASEITPLMGSPLWPSIASIKFKGKNEERLSRGEKVISLLTEIQGLGGEIVSAQNHLRAMRNTSPAPHTQTSEMTFGSTVEIQTQEKRIEELQGKQAKKYEALGKHISAINDKLPGLDSNWNIPLPDKILYITSLNPAHPNVKLGDDENAEEE